MSFATEQFGVEAALSSDSSGLVNNATIWGIFTRLVSDLDACKKGTDEIREALAAVRAATGAEIVSWYNEATGESITLGHEGRLTAEACVAFARKLLDKFGTDNDSFLWNHSRRGEDKSHRSPCGAAAVRLHTAHPDWLLAFRFDPLHPVDASCVRVVGLAAALLLKQQQHSRSYARIKESLLGFVRCMAAVVDARDSCTAGHSERVSRIAQRIGRQMNLPRQTMSDLHIGGILHDVGKIGIRDEVLLKVGKLTPDEFRHIQEHAVIGDQIVSTIKEFSRLRLGVRHHHEHYDGSGYPDGLAGEDIPLLGRILAVADTCDALMSARRYRAPVAPPQIDAVLLSGAGTQWDPHIVEQFMRCRDEIYPPIYQKGIGDSAHHSIEEIMEGLKEGSSEFFRMADTESSSDADE